MEEYEICKNYGEVQVPPPLTLLENVTLGGMSAGLEKNLSSSPIFVHRL